MTRFKDSALAHRYLDGKAGIEIGASAHNPFHIANCRNVDYTQEATEYTREQLKLCGEVAPVDIVASGDELPLKDRSQEFVLSSHVLEHFWDPIKALQEWHRILKPGGLIFLIVPHKERTFDREQPRTTFQELWERHYKREPVPERLPRHGHYSVWVTVDVLELVTFCGFQVIEWHDVDDKVGNGFTVVARKLQR